MRRSRYIVDNFKYGLKQTSVRKKEEFHRRNSKGLCASVSQHLTTKPQRPNAYMIYADKIGQLDNAKRWQKQQSVGLFNVLLASGKAGHSLATIIGQS